MTSVFDTMRSDPHAPVALTPQAAADGDPATPESGGGPSLDLFLSVGASIGSLADEMRADRDRRNAMSPPSNEQLFKAGVAATGKNLILDLGSVPLGRVWQIRRLIVGGVDVTTTAAGAAYAFKQGAPPSDLNLTNCVGIYATVPAIEKFGTHQLFLLANAHLYVVVVGGTNLQQYAAAADVEDWEDTAFQSTFSAE